VWARKVSPAAETLADRKGPPKRLEPHQGCRLLLTFIGLLADINLLGSKDQVCSHRVDHGLDARRPGEDLKAVVLARRPYLELFVKTNPRTGLTFSLNL
jgi:hypothetical protein